MLSILFRFAAARSVASSRLLGPGCGDILRRQQQQQQQQQQHHHHHHHYHHHHHDPSYSLCLRFVQPIRSVFPSISSPIVFRCFKKPGVSELVVLCHVLQLACGKKFLFSLSTHSVLHFVPSYGKNLSWRPPEQHSANLWRQLNFLAHSKANSIAHREFQQIQAFCHEFDNAAKGPIRLRLARRRSFRPLKKI